MYCVVGVGDAALRYFCCFCLGFGFVVVGASTAVAFVVYFFTALDAPPPPLLLLFSHGMFTIW